MGWRKRHMSTSAKEREEFFMGEVAAATMDAVEERLLLLLDLI